MVIVLSFIEVHNMIRLGITYMYNGWHMIAILNYFLYLVGFTFRGMCICVCSLEADA